MSAGGPSFITELVSCAGGKNIFADIPQSYPVVSEESIIMRNPDVIFIPSDSPVTVADVLLRNGWQTISAVTNQNMIQTSVIGETAGTGPHNRIVKIDADITSRSGPRIADAVLLIARTLYPEIEF
jgi:iron complex transport system substrate-binding protein